MRQVDIVVCPSYQRSESGHRICLISQSRALDTGSYIARSSYSIGRPQTGGHSLVASPDGELLAMAGAEPGIIEAEIDPKQKFLKPRSHKQPLVEHSKLIEAHRRPELYRPRTEKEKAVIQSPFPRLCAHRGLSLGCPENTLPAFGAALALGVHEIEFDLWMSRDGVAAVCHDPAVDRTTDGMGLLGQMDWADIRKLDAGIECGDVWRGVRIPRFEEVVELVDGRAALNIHIKDAGNAERLVRQVCEIIRRHGFVDTIYIAGDCEQVLEVARNCCPEVARACLLAQGIPSAQIELAGKYGCRRIQFGRGVTEAETLRGHEAGLICNLFWSDDFEDAMDYVRRGIDVILTNCANTLIGNGFPSL